jgi:hypothetical protein
MAARSCNPRRMARLSRGYGVTERFVNTAVARDVLL